MTKQPKPIKKSSQATVTNDQKANREQLLSAGNEDAGDESLWATDTLLHFRIVRSFQQESKTVSMLRLQVSYASLLWLFAVQFGRFFDRDVTLFSDVRPASRPER